MSLLSGLLFLEYYSFKANADKLLQLKEDYQNYVQALKEMLDELEQQKSSEVQKKKIDNLISFPDGANIISSDAYYQGDFSAVNRDETYLRDVAFAYAEEHGMLPALVSLYDQAESFLDKEKKASHKKPKKRVTKKRVVKVNALHVPDFPVRWPVDKSKFWISSLFGPRKKKDGSWGFHYGLDMAALKGTPVYSLASGIVDEVSYSPKGYGKSIVIAHSKKYRTRYAHLNEILVKKGQRIWLGQLIGKVGDTGAVRGKNASHLHLEVSVFGKRINPLYILS